MSSKFCKLILTNILSLADCVDKFLSLKIYFNDFYMSDTSAGRPEQKKIVLCQNYTEYENQKYYSFNAINQCIKQINKTGSELQLLYNCLNKLPYYSVKLKEKD